MDNKLENNKEKTYTHRLLARIVVETATPLAVGSGNYDALTDALVATDVNGLPYIPATAIAGVIRGMLKAEDEDKDFCLDGIFGCQKRDSVKGSEIIFSEAKIINSKGEPVDGLRPRAIDDDSLLRKYKDLPVRQHVRLSQRGVVDGAGKFDEQVVYAGTRFCFEVEMVAKNGDISNFRRVLSKLYGANFRIGGGSRKGFGELTVRDIKIICLNLTQEADLDVYLSKCSALDSDFWKNAPFDEKLIEGLEPYSPESFLKIDLKMKPEGFFLFSSGFGDDDVDAVPVKASKVIWKENGGKVSGEIVSNLVLIPATSVKGALAHRVAFHWNRMNRIFSDTLSEKEFAKAAEHNEAVEALFGAVNGSVASRGNVLISDIIKKGTGADKVFNHVAIDRFTGGAVQGALFSEKATYTPGEEYPLTIRIDTNGLKAAVGNDNDKYNNVCEAFDAAIGDLCSGMLPLGGRVNKGYGIFTAIKEK